MNRLPAKVKCRRFLRHTRAGLGFDLKSLEDEVGAQIEVCPKMMDSLLKIIPYLDDAQYRYATMMNRARRTRNRKRYREARSRRDEAVNTLADLLRQSHPKALSTWVLCNYDKIMGLAEAGVREDVGRELERFYIFPVLKS